MKSLEEAIKRWLHPFVFACWTGFLIDILVSRRFMAFLLPEFGLLLAMAHVITMGFTVAAIIHPKTTEMDVSAVLRAMVLLVPVLYAMVMPNAMLGKQVFKTRFIGTGNLPVSRQRPPMLSMPENNPDVAASPEEARDLQQNTPQELTILQILLNPKLFNGQRVIVTGMILHDELLKPHFGDRDTVVYRFLINCCAADALPLAIALDSDQADAFASDQWVQVDGIFDLQQINGKPVPVFSKPAIKAVEPPSVPFLF